MNALKQNLVLQSPTEVLHLTSERWQGFWRVERTDDFNALTTFWLTNIYDFSVHPRDSVHLRVLTRLCPVESSSNGLAKQRNTTQPQFTYNISATKHWQNIRTKKRTTRTIMVSAHGELPSWISQPFSLLAIQPPTTTLLVCHFLFRPYFFSLASIWPHFFYFLISITSAFIPMILYKQFSILIIL